MLIVVEYIKKFKHYVNANRYHITELDDVECNLHSFASDNETAIYIGKESFLNNDAKFCIIDQINKLNYPYELERECWLSCLALEQELDDLWSGSDPDEIVRVNERKNRFDAIYASALKEKNRREEETKEAKKVLAEKEAMKVKMLAEVEAKKQEAKERELFEKLRKKFEGK